MQVCLQFYNIPSDYLCINNKNGADRTSNNLKTVVIQVEGRIMLLFIIIFQFKITVMIAPCNCNRLSVDEVFFLVSEIM